MAHFSINYRCQKARVPFSVSVFHCRRVVCACSAGAVGSFSNKHFRQKDLSSECHTHPCHTHLSPYRHQSPHTRLHYDAHNAQEVRARAVSYKAYARRVPAPWGIRDLRRSQCPSAPSPSQARLACVELHSCTRPQPSPVHFTMTCCPPTPHTGVLGALGVLRLPPQWSHPRCTDIHVPMVR